MNKEYRTRNKECRSRCTPLRHWTFLVPCSIFLLLPPVDADQPARQLTTDGLLKRDPIYVESGQAVLYSARAESPRLVLMRLDLLTGKTTRFHPESNLVEFRPMMSSDGATLAFQRMTGNDVCSLFVEEISSGSEQAITTSKKTSFNATLSPGGSELIYNLSGQLYRKDIASGVEQKIAHSSGRSDWPAWSPDGQRIAFASSRKRDFDLYVTDRNGENMRQVTNAIGLDIRPAWSPDGQRLAFTSNRDRNYEIYVVNVDGSNVRRLTNHEERDDYPSWHPDGKRLVYVSERNGRYDLFELTVE